MSQFQNFYKYNIENSCKIHQKKKKENWTGIWNLGLKIKTIFKIQFSTCKFDYSSTLWVEPTQFFHLFTKL